MNRKTAFAGLAVLAAGALALTACGGGNSSPSNGSSGSAGALPLVAYDTVKSSDLADGGTLNIAVNSSPTDEGSWNPNHALAANVDVQRLLEPTLGNLGAVKEDGSWEVNKNLAESVELTSEDPQVVDIKLNPKAVWENDKPITAADWKATFEANSGAEKGYEVVPSSVWAATSAIDVKSDTELTVTFKEKFADWGNLVLVPVLPADIASNKDRFNTEFSAKPVPSAGPYVFDKIDNKAKTYSLKPNPNWWGENKPKLKTLTFKVVAQESMPQSYANDEIDTLEIATPDALQTAEGKAGAKIQRSGGLTWAHLTFNAQAEPLNDVKVRKAFAMAVDRETIARVANEPLGAPATVKNSWLFMPGQEGYSDTFVDKIGSDTNKAKETLKEAGWTEDKGGWTKDGKKLELSIIVPSGTQSNITRALGVKDALKRIDVPVNVNEVPSESYFTDIKAGNYQAATFGWQGTPFPISSSETLYTPADSPQNYTRATDERLKDLWAKANSELDPKKRLEIAKEIDGVIAEFVPSVPIYPYPEVVAVDDKIANYGTATFKSTDWSLVGYTK